jgi:UDP-3-O-[3-hydroxymyristoyl] glucosamine N-acyltransferase
VGTILIIVSSDQPSTKLFAVSFDTATYQDLESFVNEHPNYSLSRVDPEDFLSSSPSYGSYINLVIKDIELRKQVTAQLDSKPYKRFSFVHRQSHASLAKIELGCMIYPLAAIYPGVKVHRDVIVHSQTLIAHQCNIKTGTFVSGGVSIAGGASIGEFCTIGLGTVIIDKVSLSNDVFVGANTLIRKDITEPGSYITAKGLLTKIK